MIKIEKVTKTYRTKKRVECHALNGVDFVLPAKGLIFILGKSGSGKSTLLNAIGTLDGITSGKISIGKRDYNELKDSDFDNFRNSEIGFIFQDCNLIEEFSIFDNLALSMDLKNLPNKKEVISKALNSVDLSNIENKYPRELSGGQRQRVALVRTLVKDPSIILADEPTGNVDTETGKKIITLLKEFSKKHLVVVVSHNREDALIFADRVIEIEDGVIVKDYLPSKNHEIVVSNNNIIVPLYRKLTEEDIEVINANNKEDVRFVGKKVRNVNNSNLEKKDSDFEIRENHISSKNCFKYANKIYKSRIKYSILLILLTTIMLSMTAFLQSFASYDPNSSILEQTNDSELIFSSKPTKSWYKSGYYYYVSDEQKEKLEEINKHKVYESLNLNFNFAYYKYSSNSRNFYSTNCAHSDNISTKNHYAKMSGPLILADENFLNNRYGSIEVVAGDIYNTTGGVIITDYLADSMIENIPAIKSYQGILDDGNFNAYSPYVSAIIKTNYKEKYSDIFSNPSGVNIKSKKYLDFASEALTKYVSLYTLDSNFAEHYIDTFTFSKKGGFRGSASFISASTLQPYYLMGKIASSTVIEDNVVLVEDSIKHGITLDLENDNECMISYGFLNKLYGTKYESYTEAKNDQDLYLNKTIVIEDCELATGSNTRYQYTIKGILHTQGSTNCIATTYKVCKELFSKSLYRVGLVFDEYENLYDTLCAIDSINLQQISFNSSITAKLYDYIVVFKDVFKILYIIIIIGVFVLIIFDGFNSIKKNKYNIGIMRSMGLRNRDVVSMFLINSIYNTLIIGGLFAVADKYLTILINDVLFKAMNRVLSIPLNETFTVLKFDPILMLINIGVVFAMTLVSVLIQILTIKRIKPIDIIRKK